ncbi:tetratricopeptide repeat protein [Streptomyces sp. N2-109]|uniref:Tetratricopeptide repeat protein n=1 Tax=Streptomyces gossypii TaxID=2883101 RepID=A0ABT2JV86_9ACTN|nr:SAV_2336 N-terminal domain-related protein [Streptomyces gossypii]MCT2591809.1 tetratricopeptide repeat protein [Streptomyces gossypii]
MSTPPRRRQPAGLAELIERLREAGGEPTALELAEALWLAHRTAPFAGGADPARGGEPPQTGSVPPDASAPQLLDPPAAPPPEAPHGLTEQSAPVSLYAPDRYGGRPDLAFPVHAPAASTLPGLLGLQRALRPLMGYRPQLPPVSGPLDEDASAELSARSGAVRPVFGRTERRGAEIQLLMDASTTASVWQLTFDCLRQTCEQLGAFRDVQALYLHRAPDGTPLIGTGPEREATRLRPADQYRDTTGRRLTLIVSDCVGPLWQDGGAQRLLHRWSSGSPLAVVQPLPPRLWPRTALPAEPGVLLRAGRPGTRLSFERDGYGPPPPEDALPVPVLLPTPGALGSWASLLGGGGTGSARGAAAWVRPRHHAMPVPAVGGSVGAGGRGPDPRELLRAFRASASPGALQLAVHLTAVPLVLPVIQLVQEAILPGTGPMELAEVLLSGLLERLPGIDGSPGPRYVFVPGVQELLFQSLDRSAAMLVLKYVSEYVTRRFGKGTRNFPALAVAQLSGLSGRGGADATGGLDVTEVTDAVRHAPGQPDGHPADDLFAEVPAQVVRWYAPEAPASSGLAEAWRLLRRWWEQGDPELLRIAREHAEAAIAALERSASAGSSGTAGSSSTADPAGTDPAGTGELSRARLVLGQVLHALTETGAVRREPRLARSLLHDAAAQLSGQDLDTRFALAAVQHDLWEAEGDPAHLHAARRTLSRMADEAAASGRPLPEGTEVRRRLWLGRVLLALSRSEQAAGTGQRTHAAAAVRELRAAAGLLESAGGEERRLCAVLLDLSGALREVAATPADRLANLDRAEAAAGDSDALRLRCARARARVHRDTGDWAAADFAYAAAEAFAERDSPDRGELLAEWGTMLLDGADDTTRAEGVLREALTAAPPDGPLAARLPLLLGRALVARFAREHFLPDLYEGSHLLEQAARKARDSALRAEAWRLLGSAEQQRPDSHLRRERTERTLRRSLAEARRARGRAAASVAVARACHALAAHHERQGRTHTALTDYRAAAAEWQQLASELHELPWAEVRETRERVAALEAG